MKQIFITSNGEADGISYFEYEPAILVSMRREDLQYLRNEEFSNFCAIYVLIGGNKRYVGQAAGQTIYQRLSQHFLNHDKDWAKSVIFFSRYDGKMTKAETDYLEKKLIEDYKEKSEFDLTNSTAGNTSFIDRLQSAKSKQLYETVFKIIDEIADIDLFGVNDAIDNEIGKDNDDNLTIEFDNKKIESSSARGILIKFVQEVLNEPKYKNKLEEVIVDEAPSSKTMIGKKEYTTPSRKTLSVEVQKGIWLYCNYSKKMIKDKLLSLSNALGIKAYLNWK